MEVNYTNRNKDVFTSYSMMGNGILGNVMGVIFSVIIIIVGLISGIIAIANVAEFIKTKNYIQLNAQVTDRIVENDLAKNTISYTVEGNTYTDTFFGLDKNVGDIITIYYNPQNPNETSLNERSIPIVSSFLAIFFLSSGLMALVRNIKKFKYVLHPQQYSSIENNESSINMSFGQSAINQRTTTYDPFNSDDLRREHEMAEGDTTTFKF